MCTASWAHQENGYTLFFNRDELRTRKIARPPEVRSIRGVRFIAPIDTDAHGSWIGVNEFGISICLLNYYHSNFQRDPEKNYTSRGRLLLSLMKSVNQSAVVDRLTETRLTDFPPFIVAVLEPGKPVMTFTWPGTPEDLWINPSADCPLSSSSFDSVNVIGGRKELYAAQFPENHPADLQRMQAFHKSHAPEASAYSVCMHRDDARSVSLSRIAVSEKAIEFQYAPGAPCETEFLPGIRLKRQSKPVSVQKTA